MTEICYNICIFTIFDKYLTYLILYFYKGDDFMYVLVILLFVIGILILKNKPTSPTLQHPEILENFNEESKENKDVIDYKTYYKPKTYITTKNEKCFYNVLLGIAKELNYTLFAQVPLYAIVTTQNNLDYSTQTKYFNKISCKSIDFVLVDEKCRILLCIELDDNTHYKKNRIERDEFINKLFKDLGISLLRYPVYTTYYKDTLKKRILENIKDDVSV